MLRQLAATRWVQPAALSVRAVSHACAAGTAAGSARGNRSVWTQAAAAGVTAATLGAAAALASHSPALTAQCTPATEPPAPQLLESERSTINLFNASCPSVAFVTNFGGDFSQNRTDFTQKNDGF